MIFLLDEYLSKMRLRYILLWKCTSPGDSVISNIFSSVGFEPVQIAFDPLPVRSGHWTPSLSSPLLLSARSSTRTGTTDGRVLQAAGAQESEAQVLLFVQTSQGRLVSEEKRGSLRTVTVTGSYV